MINRIQGVINIYQFDQLLLDAGNASTWGGCSDKVGRMFDYMLQMLHQPYHRRKRSNLDCSPFFHTMEEYRIIAGRFQASFPKTTGKMRGYSSGSQQRQLTLMSPPMMQESGSNMEFHGSPPRASGSQLSSESMRGSYMGVIMGGASSALSTPRSASMTPSVGVATFSSAAAALMSPRTTQRNLMSPISLQHNLTSPISTPRTPVVRKTVSYVELVRYGNFNYEPEEER